MSAVELRFLTRRDCPLCDEAEARLQRWAPRIGLTYTSVDVFAEPEIAGSYGDRIPVLLAPDGRVVAEGRWGSFELISGLLRERLRFH